MTQHWLKYNFFSCLKMHHFAEASLDTSEAFKSKPAGNAFFACFRPYVRQPDNHIG